MSQFFSFLHRYRLTPAKGGYCLGLFLLIFPLLAQGQEFVFDLASYLELVTQYHEMIQEATTLTQQAGYLQQQLNAIKTLNSSQYQWSNVSGLINQVGGVLSQANGLTYTANNLNQAFQQQFPGYQAPQNYSQQYQQNTTTTLNTLNGILQTVGLNAQDFSSETTRLSFLQSQAQNAQGQTQAIQASAQIASEVVSQLQLLRQTLLAQTNSQVAYYANQVQSQASANAQLHQVIAAGSTTVPSYGSSGHYLTPPQF